MLSILNVQEESRNCEKLVTENDKLQEKTTKNTRNSHNIGHTLSLNSISKKNTQELIKKELKKHSNEVKDNTVISFKNKSKGTNKKYGNNNMDHKSDNGKGNNNIVIPVQVPVTNKGNINAHTDNNKKAEDVKEEYHKNWSNNSDNNNDIDKGKDNVDYKKNQIIGDGDCTKIDKGKVIVNTNYAVAMFNTLEHRCNIKLSSEGVIYTNQYFGNKIRRNVKENKHKMYNVFKKHTTIFNNKNKYTTKTISHNNEDPKT